jgi:1-pyrroline-5-carboxylate dehydrogenase
MGAEGPGKAIVAHPDVDGLTFTGSYDVGTHILKTFHVGGPYMRPVVIEMGGKNPTIVTEKADLDKAALGVMRSAFGLSGQKCSACSRVFVHEDVKEAFTQKLVALAEQINVGDPTVKENYMGPVINRHAYENYQRWVADMAAAGDVLTGGKTLGENGYFVAPTVIDNLPDDNPYWKKELFLPIVKLQAYSDRDAAVAKANDVPFGLTAGFSVRTTPTLRGS